MSTQGEVRIEVSLSVEEDKAVQTAKALIGEERFAQSEIVRVGDTVFAFGLREAEQTRKTIKAKMLKDGAWATNLKTGVRERYEDHVLMNHNATGSAVYTWNRAGTRVKYVRYLKKANLYGEIVSKEETGTVVYKDPFSE